MFNSKPSSEIRKRIQGPIIEAAINHFNNDINDYNIENDTDKPLYTYDNTYNLYKVDIPHGKRNKNMVDENIDYTEDFILYMGKAGTMYKDTGQKIDIKDFKVIYDNLDKGSEIKTMSTCDTYTKCYDYLLKQIALSGKNHIINFRFTNGGKTRRRSRRNKRKSSKRRKSARRSKSVYF